MHTCSLLLINASVERKMTYIDCLHLIRHMVNSTFLLWLRITVFKWSRTHQNQSLFTSKTFIRGDFVKWIFFGLVWKKSGLVHFQRPQARGLSRKNVFLGPWRSMDITCLYIVEQWRIIFCKDIKKKLPFLSYELFVNMTDMITDLSLLPIWFHGSC